MSNIKKILLAEDELLIAKVLRMQLEELGYSVENVVDADQAVQKVNEFNPDLIILDNYLKNGTNGVEAALKIRSNGVETPIIFVTGNSYESTLEQTRTIKNSMVLSKPVVFEQLIQIIEGF
jgi:two-component system response regulator VicR